MSLTTLSLLIVTVGAVLAVGVPRNARGIPKIGEENSLCVWTILGAP